MLHSNSKGECGICYENKENISELYKNANYKIRIWFDTTLNLSSEGEKVQNNRGEFVHCFFFRKK